MSRTTKRKLGPISTDADLWPPLRRRSDEDQEALERLLDLELDAWWRGIAQEDGVSEEEHARKEASDRRNALRRAELRDMKLLQKFVANSIGPDGKPLGEVVAKFVQYLPGEKHKKLPKDHLREAQESEWLRRKTEAAWEADRAQAILVRVYGRTPDGYKPRTDLIVAVARSGIDEQEIREWLTNRRRPDDPWPIF